METGTMLRGAAELKRLAHRYWMIGLGLSLSVHLTLLALLILAEGEEETGTRVRIRLPYPSGPELHPNIAGIIPPAPQMPRGERPRIHDGTPVPVDHLPPDSSLPTQEDRRLAVSPLGDPGGEEGGGEGVIPPDPNEEPPIFVAVEKDPVVIRRGIPEYPPLARTFGEEGRVWVNLWVDAEGRPRKGVVLKSTASIFEGPALKAAMEFLFVPAMMNGRGVAVWVSIPFQFRLKG